jgi:GT2 family glycosyltransferase
MRRSSVKRVTIAIPTFNRKDILIKAIHAHLAQSALDQIEEILIVDDGSTDGTEAPVAALARQSAVPFVYRNQPNRGQGAARNLAIREARGEILLFMDDDIIPGPDLLAEHLHWHDRYPDSVSAVLGFVTWSPEVRPTPFMNWMGLDGPLFEYGHFTVGAEVDFRSFYTCNLSLKTNFLREGAGFDEEFTGYGWEDIELGYRLQKRGMRLRYNQAAIGYHYKRMTFADACRRAETVARSFPIFTRKEAGKRFLELQAEGETLVAAPHPLRKLLSPVLRPVKKTLLNPLKLLLDSQVPLSWSLYRRFYIEAVSRQERAAQHSSSGQEMAQRL